MKTMCNPQESRTLSTKLTVEKNKKNSKIENKKLILKHYATVLLCSLTFSRWLY